MAAISLREAGEQFVASARGTIDRHGGCLTDSQVHYLSLLYDRCEAEKNIVQNMEITMISAEKAKAAAEVYFEDSLRYLQKVHQIVRPPKEYESSDDEMDESSEDEADEGSQIQARNMLETINECPED
ncbi:hypothetical protein DXG03_004071 [Asterophora parasitica]|uniref:Uncharacterized protein n=1 Tax=Asterophora parasitica TaxID=117018 RepID=A0A9P7KEC8_9AGAR|nr:hypothetical protein DXG03_004071 [Asterophora parasitica]